MKLARINGQLENLLNRAKIKEVMSPGSAVSILPTGKELCRLAQLAGELCALRKESCKRAAKKSGRKKKEPIKYKLNKDALLAAALKNAGQPQLKGFDELMESGYKPEALRSR